MGKTPSMRLWEIENGRTLEDVFSEAGELGFPGVAEKYGISYPTLMNWKRRMGVKVRQSVVIPGAVK